MPAVTPLILPLDGTDPRRPVTGEVLTGSDKPIHLFSGQASVALTTVTTDTLVNGSNYTWYNTCIPPNCKVYFEVQASVSVAGINLAVSLYGAGTLIANSTLTVTTTVAGGTLFLSPALAMPADGTLLQVMAHANGLAGVVGTGILYTARLIIR